MNCPFCRQEIQDSARFCRYCGKKLVRCPTCDKVLEYKMRFCPNDRTELPEELVRELPEWSGGAVRAESAPQKKKQRGPARPLVAALVLLILAGVGFGVGWTFLGERSVDGGESVSQLSDAEDTPGEAAQIEGMEAQEGADESAGAYLTQEQSEAENAESIAQGAQTPDASEEEAVEQEGAIGLGAVPLSSIEALPERLDLGTWVAPEVQGVEWDTDTMEQVYVCYDNRIVSYDTNGNYLSASEPEGKNHLFSIDYYDDCVFSVMRSGDYDKLSLNLYDAEELELMQTVELQDICQRYEQDKMAYGDETVPFIGGVTVAAGVAGQEREMLYICYNCYLQKGEKMALNEEQEIYEYDLRKVLDSGDAVRAERVLTVEFGTSRYGIRTLEYDRSTGNLWCGVSKGTNEYSLYCLDAASQGTQLKLVPNGAEDGWQCFQARHGLCSLGNDWFVAPIVHNEEHKYVSTQLRRVPAQQLEHIDD